MFWKPFQSCRYSPTDRELQWLYDWCIRQKINKILEFGCGATTVVLQEGCHPSIHVIVENLELSIGPIRNKYKNLFLVNTNWNDIPIHDYDMILIDSSACYNIQGNHRGKALEHAIKLTQKDHVIIIHDWHKRYGKIARMFIEKYPYELIDHVIDRSGFGIYRSIKPHI